MKRLVVALALVACEHPVAPTVPTAPIVQAAPVAPLAPTVVPVIAPPPAIEQAPPPPSPPPDAPRAYWKLDGAQPYEPVALGFAADHALYIAGTFSDKLTIGKRAIKSGHRDPRLQWFLARIAPDGKLDWLERAGADLPGTLTGMAVAPDGTVALIGQYQVSRSDGVTAGRLDGVLLVVAADGHPRWERRITGTDRQWFNGVVFDRDGSLVTCGAFGAIADFGGSKRSSVMGPHVPSVDSFVARYAADGKLVWVTSDGGADDDHAQLVAIAPSGDIVVAGEIGRSATFGADAVPVTLAGPGSSPIANPTHLFVASYAPTGRLRWATEAGRGDRVSPDAVAALADGSVLVHGQDLAMAGGDHTRGFVVELGAGGKPLQDRSVDDASGIALVDAVWSAREDAGQLVFERHDVAHSSVEGAAITLPKLPFRIVGLARDPDGRIALAGQAGKETEKELPNRYIETSYASVDVFVALAPAPDQLPVAPIRP